MKNNDIKIKNIVKRFDDVLAVSDLSFEVEAGELFGLLGPNGAGKTTFIQILTTLIQPTRGYAIIDGYDIYGIPLEAYASKRQLSWMREGLRKAGRPGTAIVNYPITTAASSFLSTVDPVAGLRPTDGVLLSVLPDVKVEYDPCVSGISGLLAE